MPHTGDTKPSLVSLAAWCSVGSRQTGNRIMQQCPNVGAVQEYWLDAWQRSILFLDVLRERGNTYLEQAPRRCRTFSSSRLNWCATAARWSGR